MTLRIFIQATWPPALFAFAMREEFPPQLEYAADFFCRGTLDQWRMLYVEGGPFAYLFLLTVPALILITPVLWYRRVIHDRLTLLLYTLPGGVAIAGFVYDFHSLANQLGWLHAQDWQLRPAFAAAFARLYAGLLVSAVFYIVAGVAHIAARIYRRTSCELIRNV